MLSGYKKNKFSYIGHPFKLKPRSNEFDPVSLSIRHAHIVIRALTFMKYWNLHYLYVNLELVYSMPHPPEKNLQTFEIWSFWCHRSWWCPAKQVTQTRRRPLSQVFVSPPPHKHPTQTKPVFFSFNGWWTMTQAWLVVGLILIQVVITYITLVIICLVFVPQVLLRQSCLDNVSNDWKTSQYSVSD